MNVEIKFEVENQAERSGTVAEHTYLWDAAKRLGVPLQAACGGNGTCDTCAVTVTHGADNLSTPTSAEMHQLTDQRRANGERLTCQARIQRAGEITVFVAEKVQSTVAEKDKERDLRQDFKELPFDKKFATLVEIEAVALSETVNFIANLPLTIGNKVVDVLAKFGRQIDKQSRHERRPTEHQKSYTQETEAD